MFDVFVRRSDGTAYRVRAQYTMHHLGLSDKKLMVRLQWDRRRDQPSEDLGWLAEAVPMMDSLVLARRSGGGRNGELRAVFSGTVVEVLASETEVTVAAMVDPEAIALEDQGLPWEFASLVSVGASVGV